MKNHYRIGSKLVDELDVCTLLIIIAAIITTATVNALIIGDAYGYIFGALLGCTIAGLGVFVCRWYYERVSINEGEKPRRDF